MKLQFILCTDLDGRLGFNNDLIYQIQLDMNRFTSLTNGQTVIMGYNTWKSLPHKPLQNRNNWIISEHHSDQINENENTKTFRSVKSMLQHGSCDNQNSKYFVIGGSILFTTIASHPIYKHYIECIHWTCVEKNVCTINTSECSMFDVRSYLNTWKLVEKWTAKNIPGKLLQKTETIFDVSFVTLCNPIMESIPATVQLKSGQLPSAELQYLSLLRHTLENGHVRTTRNASTLSGFGGRIVIDLSNGCVPLLTTKQMAWKTVIKELLWFVRGETDNHILQNEKVSIWNGNASREFLDSRGLNHYEEGDLGPVYGFQWRYSGADYKTCHTEYTGQGVDQLETIRKLLISDPTNRRLIMNAWNPSDIDKMALPPCHVLSQWYVDSDGKLWLQLYQRSGDMFLGVPFNMFSYAVLLHMMSYLTNIPPGGMVHILGDMHIYDNHIEVVSEQLKRIPHEFPTMQLNTNAKKWEDFTIKDFELKNYTCESKLHASMIA